MHMNVLDQESRNFFKRKQNPLAFSVAVTENPGAHSAILIMLYVLNVMMHLMELCSLQLER